MVPEWNDEEMEAFITESYYQNFELLRMESGVALSPEVKREGLQQVLYYWRKMREIALNVTDTEVRLSLPRQESPAGREYGIEGIVDIVRENAQTRMYDIKTHNLDYVRSHVEQYEDQLNVYAHIWKELQKQPLHGTAVICTDIPSDVKQALRDQNLLQLERAIERWDPLIEIQFDTRKKDATIRAFGQVVDQIEEHEFEPPSPEKLNKPYADNSNVRFGTHVCRNCDARFSCSAYRVYARLGRGLAERNFRQYYTDLEAGEPLDEWRTAGLEAMIEPEELI
jgi:hypothetical protein